MRAVPERVYAAPQASSLCEEKISVEIFRRNRSTGKELHISSQPLIRLGSVVHISSLQRAGVGQNISTQILRSQFVTSRFGRKTYLLYRRRLRDKTFYSIEYHFELVVVFLLHLLQLVAQVSVSVQ